MSWENLASVNLSQRLKRFKSRAACGQTSEPRLLLVHLHTRKYCLLQECPYIRLICPILKRTEYVQIPFLMQTH